MKYLVTGGGTGGHIYPALAIADEIKKQEEASEILYVGTANSMEAKIVPKAGYNFKTIRVKGLPRKINKDFFIAIKELILGLNDARKILKEYKPDMVIGTGGYVCGPILILAALKGIPTLIHEQNAYPGVTNKILARFVDRVAITFDESRQYFKKKDKLVNTGNPIRQEILNIDKDKAYEKLEVSRENFLILSFGGSGGQKSLNDAVLDYLEEIPNNVEYIHITGDRLHEDFLDNMNKRGIKPSDNVHILSYLYDMPEALNIADLVITPAGAITLAEISAIGLPSILVPKSYTAENHQEYNAHSFYKEGAAELILEGDLTGDLLAMTIRELIADEDSLDKMAKNSRKLGNINAANDIYNEIMSLL